MRFLSFLVRSFNAIISRAHQDVGVARRVQRVTLAVERLEPRDLLSGLDLGFDEASRLDSESATRHVAEIGQIGFWHGHGDKDASPSSRTDPSAAAQDPCTLHGSVMKALKKCRNFIAYSPAQPHDPSMGEYPTKGDIRDDLQGLYDEGWRHLVTYTLDKSLRHAPRIAKDIGFTHVIAGVFWFDKDQLKRERSAALRQHEYIDAFVVGNEGLLDGRYTRAQLEKQLGWFSTQFGKPVTTSETGGQYINDPTLADLGKFVFPNIQPWFNAALDPNDVAGMVAAVKNELQAIQDARPARLVVLKETWWPTGGEHAAATEGNQVVFFQMLAEETLAAGPLRLVWGESHDQPWKSEASPFGTLGPSWGLHESDGTPKEVIAALADVYTSPY